MSDTRTPIKTIRVRQCPESGAKNKAVSVKLELFPATQFALQWFPGNKLFTPGPPLQSAKRAEFWKLMYRVRRDGKWLGKGYTFFTADEIGKLIMEV